MRRPLTAALIALAATAVVGAVGASSASAARSPSLQARHDAFAFAKSYWADKGRYSLCGRVHWSVRALGDTNTLGYAQLSTCSIVINSRENWGRNPSDGSYQLPWWRFCMAAIHEWGHITGRGHSRTPGMIMASTEDMNWTAWWYPYFPGCRYDGDDRDGDDWPDR